MPFVPLRLPDFFSFFPPVSHPPQGYWDEEGLPTLIAQAVAAVSNLVFLPPVSYSSLMVSGSVGNGYHAGRRKRILPGRTKETQSRCLLHAHQH